MTIRTVSKEARARASFNTRVEAAELALKRGLTPSVANGEEFLFRDPVTGAPSHIASFTKGLRHLDNGQVADPIDFADFIRATDSGDEEEIAKLALGPARDASGKPIWRSKIAKELELPVRGWESMGAGLTFDLEGPDAQSAAMPPAPKLESPELIAEAAELYLMAIARDIPFPSWGAPETKAFFDFAIEQLNTLEWFAKPAKITDTPEEIKRRRGIVTIDNIFRGILPGSLKGPFLSQFLICGSKQLGSAMVGTATLVSPDAGDEFDGIIAYGSITINQRVRIATPGKDFMTDMDTFLDVQDAADFRGIETYVGGKRLFATMRDLATWVHFDALYEAYLNACILLLANDVPFDAGLPFQVPDKIDNQDNFVNFGSAHVLSLVTEVATRALKAVRFQKFNVHRRLRPEALGGLVNVNKKAALNGEVMFPEVDKLVADIGPILEKVEEHNFANNVAAGIENPDRSFLMPQAFGEGSPMHPSYGSGHAVVAGACVTVLKAFFDAGYELPDVFEVDVENDTLKKSPFTGTLTVEGELNKLAENIAIGRNMAGVHYFTDAHESLFLGEEIAIGILEEQKLTFGENFAYTLPKFDGTTIRI